MRPGPSSGRSAGFGDDVAGQITATSNRIRGLLTQGHLAFEGALGPHLDHPAVADLPTRYPAPASLKTAGHGHVKAWLKKHAPRGAERLTDEPVFTTLGEQTVVVVGVVRRDRAAGTGRAAIGPPPAAGNRCRGTRSGRRKEGGPPPGVRPGLRPHQVSIRPPQRSNKKLKRALFLSAFAALHHAPSRAYSDRKRAEGIRHNQAIFALARRRSGCHFRYAPRWTIYENPAPKNLASAG